MPFLQGAMSARPARSPTELLHAYLPVGRLGTLDAAMALARGRFHTIWAVEAQDVELADSLIGRSPSIGARDTEWASAFARLRREQSIVSRRNRSCFCCFTS